MLIRTPREVYNYLIDPLWQGGSWLYRRLQCRLLYNGAIWASVFPNCRGGGDHLLWLKLNIWRKGVAMLVCCKENKRVVWNLKWVLLAITLAGWLLTPSFPQDKISISPQTLMPNNVCPSFRCHKTCDGHWITSVLFTVSHLWTLRLNSKMMLVVMHLLKPFFTTEWLYI